MPFKYHPKLKEIVQWLENTLVEWLPETVQQVPVDELVYALFLFYNDSSSTSSTLSFGYGTQSVLKSCASQHSDKQARIDCMWSPQQFVPDFRQHYFGTPETNEVLTMIYKAMLAANETGRPLEDERELLMPLRSALHRVAQRLNQQDWSKRLPVSKEFVVTAVDSIGYWTKEDMLASIPTAKQAPLKARGWL